MRRPTESCRWTSPCTGYAFACSVGLCHQAVHMTCCPACLAMQQMQSNVAEASCMMPLLPVALHSLVALGEPQSSRWPGPALRPKAVAGTGCQTQTPSTPLCRQRQVTLIPKLSWAGSSHVGLLRLQENKGYTRDFLWLRLGRRPLKAHWGRTQSGGRARLQAAGCGQPHVQTLLPVLGSQASSQPTPEKSRCSQAGAGCSGAGSCAGCHAAG